jgi:hypothetical protein
MEAVAIPGEVSDLSDACLVDLLQMAPTADVLENLRDEDPERGFGAKAQAALLRCLRHPLVVAHPPGRPYRERLLKLAALAAERDGLVVDDGLAEAHAEALCEQRTSDQWCHKTFVLDVDPTPPRDRRDVGTSSRHRGGANPDPPARAMSSPALITARVSPNLFEGGTGCHEWAAGFFLAELVASHGAELFAGKRVAEIGPGVGVAATALAALTRPPLAALTLLDRDNETLTNLAANLAINGVSSRYAHEKCDTKTKNASETNVREERVAAEGNRGLDARGVFVSSSVATEDETKRKRSASTPTTPSLARLDWHDFDPAALASIRADAVVAADVLYDPTNVPALLDVTAALLGRRKKKEETLGAGVDANRGVWKKKNDADEPFALFVSAVRQPATLALFARLAAERGFEPEDVTETLGVAPGVGFRRLAEAQRAEIRVHALRPPKVESSVIS